jgi:hypothetical protein
MRLLGELCKGKQTKEDEYRTLAGGRSRAIECVNRLLATIQVYIILLRMSRKFDSKIVLSSG